MVASLRSFVRQVGRPLFRTGARQVIRRWEPYSRLFLVQDSDRWVIAEEMRELAGIASRLGIEAANPRWLRYAQQQAIFFGSHFELFQKPWPSSSHRIGTAYFHGKPGTAGIPEFDAVYHRLCQTHPHIDRLQVSHSEMEEMLLDAGVAPHKVFRIPIGINPAYFPRQTVALRRETRQKYHLPQSAVIVGSFQKDGVGWGEGLEPKLIKGPDIFLRTIERLKPRITELFVLLSGPARGYVKVGLERLGVPYKHFYLEDYPEVGQLYQVLDLYLVTARQEGGPKAVLEAMSSGIPLVTTRVGQAMDLVQHKRNGWLVAVEDVEGLAHWAEYVLSHPSELEAVRQAGWQTVQANSYQAQIPLWCKFMRGFVECDRC